MMQNAGVFNILTCKCAWRHSGVPFFHHFSTYERPKVVRTPQFFDILTSKCASRYSGVQFFTSQLQKVVRPRQFFSILTSKCASRYSGVQFFHIANSKSGPRMLCFVHFDLQMYLSLQRRAIFRHRNFKKWSAQAACNFSCVLCRATSAPAALARLLFDPADTQNIEKHSISRLP